jgi:hypothetical protein
MKFFLFFICIFILLSCNDFQKSKENTVKENDKDKPAMGEKLFELRSSDETNLHFANSVKETDYENYHNYPFIYNGSGVAVGDINNDGLADIYFAGNSSNDKLYLNKGKLKFEDISSSSGIENFPGWSMGVAMIDINADGWLDIYVCRAGPSKDIKKRTNRLFINNKNGTFTEEAEKYGLKSTDYSIQAAFFDYDLDGDLDIYLLNHPAKKRKKGLTFTKHIQNVKSGKSTTDVFYENVDGFYVNKSKEANLFNYGYRHGIAVGDINKDGYPDLYISSDFDDPDVFCINQKNKTFKNKVDSAFKHISFNSMGNEIVDINNDGLLDVFVVDMAPSDHFRSKAYMMSMNVKKFHNMVNNGLQHQYMFNTFQINNGDGKFSEIAQFSGVAKTDWSWAPLFFDMDQDGYKDLFITNGIKENFLYRDIKEDVENKYGKGVKINLQQYLDVVPSDISENVIYRNMDGVSFKNESGKWAMPSVFNSNGVATADFDNDGDLDFVTNNMDSEATLYESLASNGNGGNSLKFILKGSGKNLQALGSKVEVTSSKGKQWQELYAVKGYLSSVDTPLVFGLNDAIVASAKITWPDGKTTILENLEANKTYTVDYNNAEKELAVVDIPKTTLLHKTSNLGMDFKHKEDNYDDYQKQILLPHSQSNVGPCIVKADVDGNGTEDVFIGGAAGQSGILYLQTDGQFSKRNGDWTLDSKAEDTGAAFFDSDGDGDMDLYVVSGGAQLPKGNDAYQDRLYINDGKGHFKRNKKALPLLNLSGQSVVASDIDKDGDMDLFVGGRIIPDYYPKAPKSYFLINDKGTFSEKEIDIGEMVASALFTDYDNDGDDDLMVVGEWSPIKIYRNDNGNFSEANLESLASTTGLWFGLSQNDIDNDGDMDYFVGNIGLNTKFKANKEKKKEFHIYANDFDDNGTYDVVLSGTYHGELVPARGRECSSQQMPFIKEKFGDYKSFASASLQDIYGEKLNSALHRKADMLYSVFLKNNGEGNFAIVKLPWQAQLAPVTDFLFMDVNNNGSNEIIAVGNLYNVEVETERYDASKGAIMDFEDNGFTVMNITETGFYTNGDARKILSLNSNGKKYILVANNNGALDCYNVEESNNSTGKSITGL